jgi:hypothetical protein
MVYEEIILIKLLLPKATLNSADHLLDYIVDESVATLVVLNYLFRKKNTIKTL